MEKEEREKFTSLMMLFNSKEPVCETRLRKYKKEIIEEAIQKGYIRECGTNDVGKKLYKITIEGKKFWA